MEIHTSETHVNCIGKPLYISGSTDTNIDGIDATVDVCGMGASGF